MLNKINCLKFPTTALLVDDNSIFLEVLADQLQPQLTYKLFDKPKQALEFISSKKHRQSLELHDILYNQLDNDHIEGPDELAFKFDVSNLCKLAYNKIRHELISMVLIDYDMPGMSGIEFCQQLKGSPIKKILFTGKADSNLAVEAFNEGIIDRFILKQSEHFIAEINQAIVDMELAYFSQHSKLILNNIESFRRPYFNNPTINSLLQNHFNTIKPSEYYLIDSKGSYLFLDINGEASFFLLRDDKDMNDCFQVAKDHEADLSVLSKLKSKTFMPFIPSENLGPLSQGFTSIDHWGKLYPATKIIADTTCYYYSHIKK